VELSKDSSQCDKRLLQSKQEANRGEQGRNHTLSEPGLKEEWHHFCNVLFSRSTSPGLAHTKRRELCEGMWALPGTLTFLVVIGDETVTWSDS
jgi:hypothetical protein